MPEIVSRFDDGDGSYPAFSQVRQAMIEPPRQVFTEIVAPGSEVFAEEAKAAYDTFDISSQLESLGKQEAQPDEAEVVELYHQQRFLYNRWRRIEHNDFVLDGRETKARQLLDGLTSFACQQSAPFVPEAFISSLQDDVASITVELEGCDGLAIPLNAVVSATGFTSWQGRGQYLKDGRSSHEVIDDYASRATAIPDIENASAVILPGNQVIFVTHNSHRVAAAKLNNQATIKITGQVHVYRAKENIEL
ncbi:MAG: hypothetical protein ACREGA_02750 [Candidatus Saccharimonadales bacterium]